MTDERAAFMRAICENPEDDTVRLVFADWLTEHGEEERAEFIRVQCELAGDREADSEEQLLRRERDLFRQHCDRWFPVPKGHGYDWDIRLVSPFDDRRPAYVVSRGFVSSITCTAADWLAHADAIFWSPRQRVLCPDCGGEITVSDGIVSCEECQDEAFVPRPFPPTAQPITEVTLTGGNPFQISRWLSGVVIGTARWIDANDRSAGFIDDRWPGITFRLPTV